MIMLPWPCAPASSVSDIVTPIVKVLLVMFRECLASGLARSADADDVCRVALPELSTRCLWPGPAAAAHITHHTRSHAIFRSQPS